MNNPGLTNTAKWLGVISSAAVLILWLGIISSKQPQYTARPLPEDAWAIGAWIIDSVDVKMMVLAVAGVLTALIRKPLLMIFVFLLLFFPVGMYLLGVPGWAKVVGIAILFYMVSGFVLISTQYKIIKT